MRPAVLVAIALALATGSCGRCPWLRPGPELTAILAPKTYQPGDLESLTLLIEVVGENLGAGDATPIAVSITGGEGEEIPATLSHVPLVSHVANGHGQIGVGFGPEVAAGEIEVCVAAEGVRGRPCVRLALDPEWLPWAWPEFPPSGKTEAEIAAEEAAAIEEQDRELAHRKAFIRQAFPNTACRCVKDEADIRIQGRAHRPLEFPPGFRRRRLGAWSEGAKGDLVGLPRLYRPNVGGHIGAPSWMLVEAHFGYRIVFYPTPDEIDKLPPGFRDPDDVATGLATLCDEGQEINYTRHEVNVGRAEEHHLQVRSPDDPDADPEEFPFETSRRPETLTRDGWGYRMPALGHNGESVIKSHDHDPQRRSQGVIHWVDAVGSNYPPPGWFDADTEPDYTGHMDVFIHAWVHGPNDESDIDDCDCYVGIRTAVYDDEGVAQDPSVIPNHEPRCF